jgi:hypothetical protein
VNGDVQKKAAIDWKEPEEVVVLPQIPILSPGPGGTVAAFITSPKVLGVQTHWVGKRTRPHFRDTSSCEGCLLGNPMRWKGYLAGMVPPRGLMVLIEITWEAYRGCLALQGKCGDLVGRKIELHRMGQATNGKIVAKVSDEVAEAKNWPTFDVREALERIWFGERPKASSESRKKVKDLLTDLVDGIGQPGSFDDR